MRALVPPLGRHARSAALLLCLSVALVMGFASAAFATASDDALHVVARTDGCVSCHAGGSLTVVHAAVGCGVCHEATDPTITAAFNNGLRACSACHPTQGVDYHVTFAPAHTFSGMGTTCQVEGCHSSSLVTAHSSLVGPSGAYPQYADTCMLCHANGDPGRVPAGATAECASCHASADHASVHVVVRDDACAACHAGSGLTTVHARSTCDGCHASTDAVVVAAIAAGRKACVGCHEGVSHESLHVVAMPAACIECHSGTSLTSIHAARGCDVCHGSTDAGVASAIAGHRTDCAACHDGHADLTVAHTVMPFSGALTLTDHSSANAQCSMCHASADIRAVHGNDCSLCHSAGGPLTSFTSWAKSCRQGACHPAVHKSASKAHAAFECAECHLGGRYAASEVFSMCGECHALVDTVAPVTASDIRPSYNGPAPITLTTVDTPAPGGSGVAATYHILDGTTRVEGDSLVVTGEGIHTVEFWSVDGAGNVEEPHTVRTFTVARDVTPPATTIQGVIAGADYLAARAIKLIATDDGSVAGTFYRLSPGGTVSSGASLTAPLPAAPGRTVTYTLSYWSIDRSGNEEAHRSVTFSVTNPAVGYIDVQVYDDFAEMDADGQVAWITDAAGIEVARGVTDAGGHWVAAVPLGDGYVAHTSSPLPTPFSQQYVERLSTERPTASVWLITIRP